jgi:hypothetical protein
VHTVSRPSPEDGRRLLPATCLSKQSTTPSFCAVSAPSRSAQLVMHMEGCPRIASPAASHRWHIEALGSSAQIRCVSLSCCRYRVITGSASRAARIIQMLMRIRAAKQPRCSRRVGRHGSIRATFRHEAPRLHFAARRRGRSRRARSRPNGLVGVVTADDGRPCRGGNRRTHRQILATVQ